MFSRLRSKIFWTLDGLRGAQMQRNLDDITMINDNPTSVTSEKLQKQNLTDLLNHALDTVPYYKNSNISKADLQCFPVTDKNRIRNDFEDFQSEKFLNSKRFSVTTSGSTGTPFTVFQDAGKKMRNSTDTMYFARKAGYVFGTELYFLRVWGSMGPKQRIGNLIRNIVPVDVLFLDDKNIASLIKTIASRSKYQKSFLGYASAFERIGNYLDANPKKRDFGEVNSIITISEALPEATADGLERHFKCSVCSRYSNNENGILAQQVPNFGKNFLLNVASYVFEILDFDTDRPVADGNLGRIVVTDLFNKAMPIIRYDTGDVGIRENFLHDGHSYPVFSRVEGRKMDMVFDTKGRVLSSFLFSTKMKEFTEVKQFQFIQHAPKTYEFKLNVANNFNDEPRLLKVFKKPLGEDAEITFRYVDTIPLLSSGKRKKVVNAMGENHKKS